MIKKKNKFFGALIIMLLLNVTAQAQDNDLIRGIIQESKNQYERLVSYQLSTSYKIYEYSKFTKNKPVEVYNGLYAIENKHLYSKIGPIEIVSKNDIYLQINHELKEIMYVIGVKNGVSKQITDLSQFDDSFEKVSVEKKNNGWSCVLENPKNITNAPYSRVVLHFDSKYYVTKQELYPTKVISFKGEYNGSIADRAVIIIEFSSPKKLIDKTILDINNYVSQQGNALLPVKKLEKYELIKA